MKKSIILLIAFYQNYIRRMLPGHCRFYPSCSDYCLEAIQQFGIISGLRKGLKRILRCNPFFAGGYDPVEEKEVE